MLKALTILAVIFLHTVAVQPARADLYSERRERILADKALFIALNDLEQSRGLHCPLPEDLSSYYWRCLNSKFCRYGIFVSCVDENQQVVLKVLAEGMDDSVTATFKSLTIMSN